MSEAGTLSAVADLGDANVPFRWNLITPAQLGYLLDGTEPPSLWFGERLAECAGTVIARSAHGDLAFVGRSLDSMYDLLSGAFSAVPDAPRVDRLPFSFARSWITTTNRRRIRPLTVSERHQAEAILSSIEITPYSLARRKRPITFVDVVHGGGTFTELYDLLRTWIDREHAQWDVIRMKVRFVGVVWRQKTSPNTYRWQQHRTWTTELPRASVLNVSLDGDVWSYFGDAQPKLTRSFRPEAWTTDAEGPDRRDDTRRALAEAVAVVSYGRSPDARRVIANAFDGEPALAESWLRTLSRQLNS